MKIYTRDIFHMNKSVERVSPLKQVYFGEWFPFQRTFLLILAMLPGASAVVIPGLGYVINKHGDVLVVP